MESRELYHYRLGHIRTEGATGFFDCMPVDEENFDTCLTQARLYPNDEFKRKHLLRRISAWEPEAFKKAIVKAPGDDTFLKALYFEACLLDTRFASMRRLFPEKERKHLASASPLVYISSYFLPDQSLHRQWIRHFRSNIFEHEPLKSPETLGLAAPVDEQSVSRAMAAPVPLDRLSAERRIPSGTQVQPGDPSELTRLALERLETAGIRVGPEMRHEASLSPIALLRTWQLSLSVVNGRHHYRLDGEQTAYGRGLTLEDARVACTMEIVERASSYASISESGITGYCRDYPLVQASFSQLLSKGTNALDPNRLGLEVPYRDQQLYWMQGQVITQTGPEPILVPAQCVFLFCNLDEPKLFSGLGSNGLGAGADMAQAKCKALLEVIERDCAATIPYTPKLCFDIETDDDRIARLLQSYARSGIQVGFLDITGSLGVPCCKAFVQGPDGQIASGTSAHLNARSALLSALTEIPYPFPGGAPTQSQLPATVRVPLEALPNHDRGNSTENLALLEQLLLVNGYEPIHIDLTRSDLDLPVARAIIPGMELLGDLDRFSRVHPRLFGQYINYAQSA